MNVKTKYDIGDTVLIINDDVICETEITHIAIMVNEVKGGAFHKTISKPINIVYDTNARKCVPEERVHKAVKDFVISK